MPTLIIVLVEPQLPQNSGNIARTCAVTGARLHIVGPMGFTIDDKKLKRAGLDYWHQLDITYYQDQADFFAKNSGPFFYFTSKGPRRHVDVTYPDGAYLVFGREDAGLPEELLATTPEGIVRIMTARNSTLRQGFDDETCGELIRATLSAYLPASRSPAARLHNVIEKSFAKAFFLRQFLKGDQAAAQRMGVPVSGLDRAVFALVAVAVGLRMGAYRWASRTPLLRGAADAILVRKIRALLQRYGHAEFTSDAGAYRPTPGVRAAA